MVVDVGGGMFSWSESLSSLGVGSSGCGKQMPATLVEPSSQIQRNPVIHSWMAVSCSCECTELEGTSVAASCGGMGSGFVFSLTRMVDSVFEASDMGIGVRVDGRVEERG